VNIINDIFHEYRNRKSTLEMSVEQMKEEIAPFINKIVIYGAGSSGIAFLYQLKRIGIEVSYFADGNKEKCGTECEGIKIISPDQIIPKVGEDALVIVCINTDGKRYCKSFDEALRIGGHHGVYDTLRACGCKNIIDYTFFRRCHKLFSEEKYNAPSCSDVHLMEEHEEDIAMVYDMMEDDMSREVFQKIVEFRLLNDSLDVPTMEQEKQYFEYEFYKKNSNEIFVDCGAFNGGSLKVFLNENNNQFTRYYGLEPDAFNFERLKMSVSSLDPEIREKINCVQAGAWYDDSGVNLYALNGPGSFIADIGNEKIDTITIDKMLDGDAATYIKMNIEGSEKEALAGAEKTIQNYKPKLAIAGYHKTDDLWKIPIIMKQFRKDYKIYLRSYMNHISFVYYAV